jgi:hypothetical protein
MISFEHKLRALDVLDAQYLEEACASTKNSRVRYTVSNHPPLDGKRRRVLDKKGISTTGNNDTQTNNTSRRTTSFNTVTKVDDDAATAEATHTAKHQTTATTSKKRTVPEQNANTESKAETDAKTAAETDAKTDAETDAKTDAKTAAGIETETDGEIEAEAKVLLEIKVPGNSRFLGTDQPRPKGDLSRERKKAWYTSNREMHPEMLILLEHSPPVRALFQLVTRVVGHATGLWTFSEGRRTQWVQAWNLGHENSTAAFPLAHLALWRRPRDDTKSHRLSSITSTGSSLGLPPPPLGTGVGEQSSPQTSAREMRKDWSGVGGLESWVPVFVHPRLVDALSLAMTLLQCHRLPHPPSGPTFLQLVQSPESRALLVVIVQWALSSSARRTRAAMWRGTTTGSILADCDASSAFSLLANGQFKYGGEGMTWIPALTGEATHDSLR